MKIGHRIANARRAAGLSQAQFAKVLGVSRGIVSHWETDKKLPGCDNLAKIARVTLVTSDYLLGEQSFKSIGVYVSDPEQLELLRVYARLDARGRKNLRQLLQLVVAQLPPVNNPQRDPAKPQKVVRKHPVDQG